MSFTLSSASIPVFTRQLQALSAILDKAAAHFEPKKVDPAVLCATRLVPDMLPFTRQVQIACDFAKNTAARLAGVEAPKFEDGEKTIAELKERIARTIAYVSSQDGAAIDTAIGREIRFTVGPNQMKMPGELYLTQFALPNFFFHVTTAYAILRAAGVDIGKRDFMGAVPGLEPA